MLTTTERAIYTRRRRRALWWLATVSALAVVAAAVYRVEPRVAYFREMLLFAAPGAVLGLGASWVGHLFGRQGFTWSTGLVGAAAGTLLLPPVLAALVVLSVGASPGGVLRLFVLGSWAALAAGLLAALVRAGARLVARPLRRPRPKPAPRAE